MNIKQGISASALRQRFLSNVGLYLIDTYAAVIKGEAEFCSTDVRAREEAFSLVKEIIAGAGDLGAVDADNTQSVIGMLKDGQISIEDAKDLMQMLSTKAEIDDTKELLAKMEGLSIS